MRIELTSDFERPAPTIAELLLKPETMCFLLHPVVRVVPRSPDRFPARWEVGRYRVSMWLFGFIPLGSQDIVITEIVADPVASRWGLHDDGSGSLTRRWDHRIKLEALAEGRARYTDRVEIEAGLMTPAAWLFARLVFAWRHRRWRQLTAAPPRQPSRHQPLS